MMRRRFGDSSPLNEDEVAALTANLERLADDDPGAAEMLEWVYKVIFARIARAVALVRWIARCSGRPEWRRRAPDRRADPTACHRGPAPPAASRPHVLIVGG